MSQQEWMVLDANARYGARLHLSGWSSSPGRLRPPVGDELSQLASLGVPEGVCADCAKRAQEQGIPLP